jgi:hypothetical protein
MLIMLVFLLSDRASPVGESVMVPGAEAAALPEA